MTQKNTYSKIRSTLGALALTTATLLPTYLSGCSKAPEDQLDERGHPIYNFNNQEHRIALGAEITNAVLTLMRGESGDAQIQELELLEEMLKKANQTSLADDQTISFAYHKPGPDGKDIKVKLTGSRNAFAAVLNEYLTNPPQIRADQQAALANIYRNPEDTKKQLEEVRSRGKTLVELAEEADIARMNSSLNPFK